MSSNRGHVHPASRTDRRVAACLLLHSSLHPAKFQTPPVIVSQAHDFNMPALCRSVCSTSIPCACTTFLPHTRCSIQTSSGPTPRAPGALGFHEGSPAVRSVSVIVQKSARIHL